MAIELDSLWDFGDASASEVRFREALDSALEPVERAEILTQLGRAVGLQRRFDDALEVIKGAEKLAPPNSKQTVRVLLERGRVYNSRGEPEVAKGLFLDSYALAEALGLEALAVDAAHMVAIASPSDQQIPWNERALEIARSSSDPKAQKWRASLLNNLGWTYFDLGKFEIALHMFEEARELRELRNEPGLERIARYCIGKCLRAMGRFDEACSLLQALQIEQRACDEGAGYVEEEIGECLLALGRPMEAGAAFGEALEKLEANGELEGEPERLARIRVLAGA